MRVSQLTYSVFGSRMYNNTMSNIINNPLIEPLVKASSIRTYGKGQTIIYPDDSTSQMYLVKSGAVMMESIDQSGERKILYSFGPSTLFPMVSFLDKGVASSWFYTTLTDTELYILPYAAVTEKLKEVDGFTAYNLFLRQMLDEVHELLLHISDHSKTDSAGKLLAMFLFLLKRHTKQTSNVWQVVQFPVTHQLLADMTGLTRETVTLGLKDFADEKLIRYQEKGTLELNVKNLGKQQRASRYSIDTTPYDTASPFGVMIESVSPIFLLRTALSSILSSEILLRSISSSSGQTIV
jgi:CRP-like cAMP-binding protein